MGRLYVIVCPVRMENEDLVEDKNGVYELGFQLVPTIADEHVASQMDAIKATISKHKGVFISEDFPKLKPLAYTMAKTIGSKKQKFDQAYFGWVKFETASNNIPSLKTELDKNENILRSMIIVTVRENTLVSQRIAYRPGAPVDGEKAKEEGAKPVSIEELDKTIENLVVE